MVEVRWGDRRLHAEALDADGRRSLVLGRGADVELGADVRARLEWTPLGLNVALSTGFTGRASLKGDRPQPLHGLVARGRAKELGNALHLFLEANDALLLRAGALKIDARPAFVPVRRLPLDVKKLATLGLALFAVALVIASVFG
jgi:hypothetical protein